MYHQDNNYFDPKHKWKEQYYKFFFNIDNDNGNNTGGGSKSTVGNKKISVIIPTYNREKLLKNCLLSLLYQDYPKKYYELIVVDDGGNDGTLDMVKGLDINLDFKYVYWPRNKPYVFGEAGNRAGPARDLGVKFSGGELLIFLDSDIFSVLFFTAILVDPP